MGRSPCCDKIGLKKGPWTPEEDQKLLAYIEENGHGWWRALPSKAGLQRCGKSCRLRWTNYLRPDIKRGKFNLQEEQTIIQLHALLGNRWSAIATHLPKRTDNEIKNYWNTHLKKRLTKMGIDPITHKPKNDTLITSSNDGTGQSKSSANLSHMAQWESARLEAEARLVRESRLRSRSTTFEQHPLPLTGFGNVPSSLDLSNNAWQGIWSKTTTGSNIATGIGGLGIPMAGVGEDDLESPTSTLSFSENNTNHRHNNGLGQMMTSSSSHHQIIDFVGSSISSFDHNDNDHQGSSEIVKNELVGHDGQGWKLGSFESSLTLPDISFASSEIQEHFIDGTDQGFTDLLINNFSNTKQVSGETESNDNNDNDSGSDDYEEKKNYWDTILNLVNSSLSDSSIF